MRKLDSKFRVLLLTVIVVLAPVRFLLSADSFKRGRAVDDSLKYLNIPDRTATAVGGTAFANQVTGLSIEDREKAVVKEILAGNVPSFSRKLRTIKVEKTIGTTHYELEYYVVCDYMAIGSDMDYLYIPMTPSTAQFIADRLDCTLPTKKMVDDIYAKAEVKLTPQPIPPSDKMTTVPVFKQHTDSIKQQISTIGLDRLADNIIGGHKKDIIISNKIYSPDKTYERVVIYGWHKSINNPIQPMYNGHIAMYADYSHGVRLISNQAFLNGDSVTINSILLNSTLSGLLSDEGVIDKPYYPDSDYLTSMNNPSPKPQMDFKLNQNYPNPFNPTTTINYFIPINSNVELSIFNSKGDKVAVLVSKWQERGSHTVKWNAGRLASGLYVSSLKAGLAEQNCRMILLK